MPSSRTVLTAVAAASLAACAVAAEAPEADRTGATSEAIYANTSLYWPSAGSARVDIGVCFENPNSAPGATAADRATWRNDRRLAVSGAWGRFGRIRYSGWDGADPVNNPHACAAGEAGLHVLICENVGSTIDSRCPQNGASQTNNPVTGQSGYPGLNGTTNGIRINPAHPPSIWVHELGHALGFYHEEEIPGASGKCQEQSFPNSNPIEYGSYDPNGIMSYCNPPTTAPFLSPNDIAAIGRSYGRHLEGSLVSPGGKCGAAHWAAGVNDPAFVWDCDEANHDQEFLDTTGSSDGNARNLYLRGTGTGSATYCVAATGASTGQSLRLEPCTTATDWLFQSMSLRGFGGLCLDLENGSTAAGTRIQVYACGALGGVNQHWTLERDGHIQYGTSGSCAAIDASGHLTIAACANVASQLFAFGGGKISRISSGKCLDVQGPNDAQYVAGIGGPANGAIVQEATCNTSMNQKWNLNGAIRYGANSSLCMTRAGMDKNGTPLVLSACNGAATEEWDYYF